MDIRRLSVGDLYACIDVASDVGWATPRAHWTTLLRFGEGYGLFDEEQLAGTVVAFPHETFTFIGMMLVRRRFQGRGYARFLLEHVIREKNDTPLALVATEMGQPLYRRLGFVERERIVTHQGRWDGNLYAPAVIEEPSHISEAQRFAILSADRHAFGVRRTMLINALLGEISRVATIERDGRLSYAFAWQHEGERHIGPVVAVDDTAAFDVIATLVSDSVTQCRISVPAGRTALRTRIEAHGLCPVRSLPLMTRGAVPPSRGCWYGIALPSTG